MFELILNTPLLPISFGKRNINFSSVTTFARNSLIIIKKSNFWSHFDNHAQITLKSFISILDLRQLMTVTQLTVMFAA